MSSMAGTAVAAGALGAIGAGAVKAVGRAANNLFHKGGKKSAAARMAKTGIQRAGSMRRRGYHEHIEKLTKPASNHITSFKKTYWK